MSNIDVLQGLTLREIRGMHRGSDEITFVTTRGRQFRMFHSQNCCENVELEDVCGDEDDLLNSPITISEQRSMQGPSRYESSTWTFYELGTNRGTVTLRWLGTSNGYYSEKVSFEEMPVLSESDEFSQGHSIMFRDIDDDNSEVVINDEIIAVINVDDDGSHCRDRVEHVLKETARILGIKFSKMET
jgi:hypothetical protein